MTICSACSEERPNSFFLDSFSCSSSHSFCSVRLVMTCACSCSRAASFASSLACCSSNFAFFASSFAFRAFSCCNRSYSAREMVPISAVLLVCISLFFMQTLYHRMRQKASVFNGFRPFFLLRQWSIPLPDGGLSAARYAAPPCASGTAAALAPLPRIPSAAIDTRPVPVACTAG